jgi:hypothetical protein
MPEKSKIYQNFASLKGLAFSEQKQGISRAALFGSNTAKTMDTVI